MSHYNFKKDLAEALPFEEKTAALLRTKGIQAKAVKFKKGEYDGHPPDILIGKLQCDVKHEKYSKKSGKIFVEVNCLLPGNLDFLIYLTDYDNLIHILPAWGLITRLTAMQKQGDKAVRYISNAGDSRFQKNRKPNPGYVISIEDLKTYEFEITLEQFKKHCDAEVI